MKLMILTVLLILDIISVDMMISMRWYSSYKAYRIIIGILVHLAVSAEIIMCFAEIDEAGAIPGLSEAVEGKWFPVIMIWPVFVLVYSTTMLAIQYFSRRKIITRTSIREAVENLECGLCYAETNGTIILENHCMYDLVGKMFGRHFVNTLSLWDNVISVSTAANFRRIDFTSGPAFLFEDGSVWAFQKNLLKDADRTYIEIIAREVTRLYGYRVELERENRILTEVEDKLSQSYRNIAETRQEEELLSYKMRIHDQLGNAIIRMRKLLGLSEVSRDERDAVLKVWDNTISAYRKNSFSGDQELAGSMEEIKETAGTLGCTIEMSGELPLKSELMARIVRESMYNAIKHASATILWVEGKFEDRTYKIDVHDNGETAVTDFAEGGGISSLRHSIESVGGTMSVHTENGFRLSISLPESVS